MIASISLQNFRSYTNDSFEFENGVNIMVGPNACGKTNLLEAILVLFRGASYRAKDIDLIRFENPWARLEATIDGHSRTLKLQRDVVPLKSFDIDGKTYNRLPSSNRLPIVLFEPNHLQLLSGSPEGRRTYLDECLEQTVAGYGPLTRKYNRVLAQRNALLKMSHGVSGQQLFPWNVRLSQLAGQIVKYRNQLSGNINERLRAVYDELSGSGLEVSLVYKPQLPIEDFESHHMARLETSLNEDLNSGHTGYGPHRDDFILSYDNHPASLAASRGEMRTGILALKMIQLEMIERDLGVKPVLLLDDVFSELDGLRRNALTDRLMSGQSFITTTDADIVMNRLAGHCNVIPLSQELT